MHLPRYAELLERGDAPPGSSWGLFGADDRIGTLNLVGPEQARAAADCVRTGESFTLDYPLDAFDPPLAPTRRAPVHRVFSRHADHRDDLLDGFYLQASTQLDGLRHRRHHVHGFYNGVPDGDDLGIHHWAERGIVARGLLLDVSAAAEHAEGRGVSAANLQSALDKQGVTPQPGDVLLLHTGWADWYQTAGTGQQERVRAERRFTGVEQTHEVLAWLWDHHFAAVVSDTYAFEMLPARSDSPFGGETDHGMMHQQLIALLGLAVGELWRLGPLAAVCARDDRWTCLLTAKPLNLRGGVGSPANATAVR
ncbi:cyclase family protein [Streptomyces sp. P17]|uniref:cyclase family protein n=1 Tax=Streptomyces sp. P17 TaxID=3074716 RepID=UPI0028F45A9A|nr:cyclase family protein [Streptomyces sp. P17]MDT9697954.1 cyclase family protein [Streptomyces sp. P17]